MAYPHFTDDELRCHCGQCDGEMDPGFMGIIEAMRQDLGFPFRVTSAYRCPEYNASVSTTGTDGPHTTGKAIDIGVYGEQAYRLLNSALANGIKGIGIKQTGKYSGRFIHLDQARTIPWVWTY